MFLKSRVRELERDFNLMLVKLARLEAENTMLKGSLTALTHEYQGVQATLSALVQSGLRVWVTDKRTEEKEKRSARAVQAYKNRKPQSDPELPLDSNHATGV
jgi:hypothetical protein